MSIEAVLSDPNGGCASVLDDLLRHAAWLEIE
jgi:hypothetical protein